MGTTYKISILLFILLLSPLPWSLTSRNTDIIQSLQIDFTRDFSEKESFESAVGTLYYSFPTHITIHVKEPVEQWMILKKYRMDIYYPLDRKVFLFKTENPISLPFFHAFIGVVKKDYGLIDLGYSLAYHRKREPDTLVTVWVPPKKASKVLGDFTLLYVSGKITYAEFKNPKGKILSKTFYGNHCEFEGINFPLSIETVRYTGADSTVEHITYSNPHFNTEIPDTILSFTIPDEVITKEFDW
jgi:outer membrane lipoprotein-sorting protein